MLKVAILDDYTNTAQKNADWSPLREKCEVTAINKHLSEAEAAEVLKPYDVICSIRERMLFPRSFFAALPNLKLVTTIAPRLVGMDLPAATEHGVLVCHDYLRRTMPHIVTATPELAWGLMISTIRHIPQEVANFRAGGWQHTVGDFILRGKTLGILGLGKIGQNIARYGKAFEMDIIAWSQNLDVGGAAVHGARYVSKENLFKQADVLFVCYILSDRSRGIVGAEDIARMKPTAYLINPSRGPLIDETALIEALRNRKIAGAGLDVLCQEPPSKDHPFRTMDNVIVTPHLGYNVNEAMHFFYTDTVDTVLAFANGTPVRIANPDVLTSAAKRFT